MSHAEKRAHPRSQYFLVKSEGQPLPVYSFRDERDLASIPALVVDSSEGGVQILTAQTDGLSGDSYELELASSADPLKQIGCVNLRKIWQKTDGLNIRTGFAISSDGAQSQFLDALITQAPNNLLRCVLRPCSA